MDTRHLLFFGGSHGCSHSFCGMSSYALSVLGCTNCADFRILGEFSVMVYLMPT